MCLNFKRNFENKLHPSGDALLVEGELGASFATGVYVSAFATQEEVNGPLQMTQMTNMETLQSNTRNR